MFLLKLSSAGSLRRFLARSAFALLVLPAAFLVMGCDTDGPSNINTSLGGTWLSAFDRYNINLSAQTLVYDGSLGEKPDGLCPDEWDLGFIICMCFTGDILEIAQFDGAGMTGVIFLRFTEKPHSSTPAHNYGGIFFNFVDSNTARFALPIGQDDPWPAVSSETLDGIRGILNAEEHLATNWALITAYTRQP